MPEVLLLIPAVLVVALGVALMVWVARGDDDSPF